MGKDCQMCGTPNQDGVQFCSACGSPLTDEARAPREKAAKGDEKAKTMLFGKAPVIEKAPEKSGDAAGAKAAETAKTVLGLPSVDGAPRTTAPVTQATPVMKAETPKKKPVEAAKTVLGMAAVAPEAVDKLREKARTSKPPMAKPSTPGKPDRKPSQPSQPSQPSRAAAMDKKTVLGMPAMGSEEPSDQKVGQAAPTPAATPVARAAPDSKPSQREEPAVKQGPEPSTMAGEPRAQARSYERTPQQGQPDAAAASGTFDEWPDEEPTTGRRGIVVALIATGVLVLIALFILIYLVAFDRSTALKPQVFPSVDGKSVAVAFSFPEAPPGTTVQVGSQSVPVTAGQARIDIPMNQLKLGTNDIQLVYTEPGKSPEQMSFPIALRHSISTDLSGLSAEQPFVTIGFKVAPGMQLAVEGKPVQVVDGVYNHRLSLEALASSVDTTSDNLIHRVAFQLIDSSGATEQGQHMVAVPMTKLQIDRPADKAAVASDTVTCAGVTEHGAQVTVAGKPVGVTAVGFNTTVPLATIGDHRIEVTARAPGKAPRTSVITVKRIESLASEIEAWSSDLDKDLDYPKIGRDPNAHVGKKIRLDGRVVNINTEKGVTAFLLYIAESCPTGARCAVYVVFRGETEAGIQSWVDVYGTVRGTRSVDLPSGQKLEVPAVEAEFVVKSEKRKTDNKKKRRR